MATRKRRRSASDLFVAALLSSCVIALVSAHFAGCHSGSSGGGGTTTTVTPTPAFSEVTLEAGIDYEHTYTDIDNSYILISGGVAAGDYDGDGWVDLYVVGGQDAPNRLYRNRGDGSFEEVGAAAGVEVGIGKGCGPAFADLDGDGRLDLFVGGVDGTRPSVFHNAGDGTFDDITATSGIVIEDNGGTFVDATLSATFGDYDRDGDLDIFLSHWDTNYDDGYPPQHLWLNNGDGTFVEDVLDGAGEGTDDYTFTGNFADIDNDGWPDLLLASDFGTSEVFLNQGDGTFVDVTTGVITDENGMCAAVGDYDNDGDLDWFVSSIRASEPGPFGFWGDTGNRLYRNPGNGDFEDVTDLAGVRDGGWGWASSFADLDNDGHLDLVHVNGFWLPHIGNDDVEAFVEDPTRVFMSNGDGTFTEKAASLGIDDRRQGRGLVCFDYDRDGDIDLFIANNGQAPRLYRNNLAAGHTFLQVALRDTTKNSQAVGARVYVTAGGTTQMREVRCGSNFVSNDPADCHFGLGGATTVEQLRIVWPNGTEQTYDDVAANQRLTIAPAGIQQSP